MKANEAPEKIFISYETDEDGCIYPDYMWHRHQFEGVENIEYIRKDAFIEKAVDYIANNMRCDGYTLQTKAKFIKDFKNYMKA